MWWRQCSSANYYLILKSSSLKAAVRLVIALVMICDAKITWYLSHDTWLSWQDLEPGTWAWHGQTGHCNWNNSRYHKCIFSIIKMLWVLSIYGIIQIYCFVLCTYNISQQKYTNAINVLQSIFTEIKNVCRGQQSMMLMEAPPGARSSTAKGTVDRGQKLVTSKLLLCCRPINLCWSYQHQPGRVSTGTQHINTAINM